MSQIQAYTDSIKSVSVIPQREFPDVDVSWLFDTAHRYSCTTLTRVAAIQAIKHLYSYHYFSLDRAVELILLRMQKNTFDKSFYINGGIYKP